jgi:hypothetical protein
MDINTFITQLNDDEIKLLYMIDHIDNINNYALNQYILIRYTNSKCIKCENNTSDHKHYYCYNCVINTENWLNILNTYNNILQNN